MSASILREAAALIRERAEDASNGPWKRFGMAGVAGADWEVVDERRVTCDGCNEPVALLGCATNADAEHIASWHPAVALAVAKAMDAVADAWEIADEANDGLVRDPDDDLIPFEDTLDAGWLEVARAYLRRSA